MWRNLRSFLTHPPSLGAGMAFAIMSLLFGTWITRIPDIQSQTQLGEGALGLALLGMPIGAITIMPFLGTLTSRFGTGKVTFYAAICYSLSMALPAMAFNFWTLAAALVVVGTTSGAMDVAMNAMAAEVEQRDNRNIMSTCHAFFSFGGMVGAAIASVVAGWGYKASWHLWTMAALMVIFSLAYRKSWLAVGKGQSGGHQWVWPTKPVLVLAAIGFCVLMSEGAIADWSAIYLKKTLQGDAFISGIGFAGFSLTMALGRLYGDILIPKWGGRRIVIIGSLISTLALLMVVAFPNPLAAILGFTLAGVGLSCIVPIIFSAGAQVPGMSAGGGIAAIASMGYAGFMAGPPLIGFMAEAYGLRWGMALVGLVIAVIVILGLVMRK